ncbi:endonuclease [Photobacterium kishitanii]|uniref:Endonuclease n=2 Tax=Photobacterium kishitanii TaxID=318456 RepID=A0A2T3KKU3_9GAMM|nr:endonuclease [Photobacterium kishitanii]PSV00135.1 endonuclease [Photobacterium kishitanii]
MMIITMPIFALLLLLLPISDSYAQPFTLMSWNMQWLSLNPKSPIVRSAADYQALKQLFTIHSPDILAFQEVDSTEALYRVINQQHYKIYLSSRTNSPQDSFTINNQYTGFAIKHGIDIEDITDLSQLSSPAIAAGNSIPFNNKLRYGSMIRITINKQSIILLNLHLKSGCFTAKQLAQQKGKSCKTLAQQLKLIKHWVSTQQARSQPFIIVGDFNHRIKSGKTFIDKITNDPTTIRHVSAAISANCTVKLASRVTRYRTYRALIDHLFTTTNIKALDQRQIQYDKQQISQFTLSDHCPLLFTLAVHSSSHT